MTKVRESSIVKAADYISQSETTWDARLIGLGSAWAEGKSLNEVLANIYSPTDVSGDLVGAFRRARELAGQLKTLWIDDEARTQEINQLIRTVTREEVAVVG